MCTHFDGATNPTCDGQSLCEILAVLPEQALNKNVSMAKTSRDQLMQTLGLRCSVHHACTVEPLLFSPCIVYTLVLARFVRIFVQDCTYLRFGGLVTFRLACNLG